MDKSSSSKSDKLSSNSSKKDYNDYALRRAVQGHSVYDPADSNQDISTQQDDDTLMYSNSDKSSSNSSKRSRSFSEFYNNHSQGDRSRSRPKSSTRRSRSRSRSPSSTRRSRSRSRSPSSTRRSRASSSTRRSRSRSRAPSRG